MAEVSSVIVRVCNRLGLHARAATMFAQHAADTSSEITVRRCDDDTAVDGRSVLKLMILAANEGTDLEITATGPDAGAAARRLAELVEARFHEES